MYIRFKNIPEDEISNIRDGDLGVVAKELGVSCYHAVEDNGTYKIVVPSLCLGSLYDLIGFISDAQDNDVPIYLIEGNEVGVGNYGEPVVKDVLLVSQLKIMELADPKPKFKMDRTNPQFVKYSRLKDQLIIK